MITENAHFALPALRRHPRASDGAAADSSTNTLVVAASATLLVLAIFSAVVPDVHDSIQALHGGLSGQTWVLSAMSMGMAAALLTAGALADDLGRRRVLVWSTVLLATAGVIGAIAPTVGVLVAARLFQGAAGAGVVASSLGLIGHAFPAGGTRTLATSVWGAAVGGGIALGPVLGAALTTSLGWRSSYWLQAIGAAVLVPAAAAVAESRSGVRRPLDIPGAIALTSAMAALTAGLIEGRTSWTAPLTIALLGTRSPFAGAVRGDRAPPARADARSAPVPPAAVRGVPERGPVHRACRDRGDERLADADGARLGDQSARQRTSS